MTVIGNGFQFIADPKQCCDLRAPAGIIRLPMPYRHGWFCLLVFVAGGCATRAPAPRADAPEPVPAKAPGLNNVRPLHRNHPTAPTTNPSAVALLARSQAPPVIPRACAVPAASVIEDLHESLKTELVQWHVRQATEILHELYRIDPVGTDREVKRAALNAAPAVSVFACLLLRLMTWRSGRARERGVITDATTPRGFA